MTEADTKLNDAETIALSMSLDASAIKEHRSMLIAARGTYGKPVGGNPIVSTPMQDPTLILPGVAVSVGSTSDTQLVAAQQADPGKMLLLSGQAELRAGQLESARKIVSQVLNGPYSCKREAADLLRSIDAEEFVQRQRTAGRAYENGIFAYQERNYEHALAIFRQIDPTLLTPYQSDSLKELMRNAGKVVASKQSPNSSIVRAGGVDPGLPNLPPSRKPTMPSDMLPDPMATRTGPDSLLKQTEALQQITFQKLRSEELKVESDAVARFGKGETDEAIRDLQNFISKVKHTDLDQAKVALLTRPAEDPYRTAQSIEASNRFPDQGIARSSQLQEFADSGSTHPTAQARTSRCLTEGLQSVGKGTQVPGSQQGCNGGEHA